MPDQCQANDVVAIFPQDSLLVVCVVVVQERKGQGNQMKKDHLTSLQTEWQNEMRICLHHVLGVHVFEHA